MSTQRSSHRQQPYQRDRTNGCDIILCILKAPNVSSISKDIRLSIQKKGDTPSVQHAICLRATIHWTKLCLKRAKTRMVSGVMKAEHSETDRKASQFGFICCVIASTTAYAEQTLDGFTVAMSTDKDASEGLIWTGCCLSPAHQSTTLQSL